MKLLINNEAPTVSFIKVLEEEGFLVEKLKDLSHAARQCALYFYDVLIIHTGPQPNNICDLLSAVKENSPHTGIIVISPPVHVKIKIEFLLAGADDYLVMPFDVPELTARVKTLIRRCSMGGEKEIVHHGVKISPEGHRVSCCGKQVRLTRKEYELLFYFLRNPNRILTHEMIAEYLWGDFKSLSADCFDFIYCHIKNIRKKLSSAGAQPLIDTVYGVGYIMK